jgi:hypothetical protein
MPSSPETRRARWAEYARLCEKHGESTRQPFGPHFAELRRREDERRLTKEDHYAYWTERFSMEEIRKLAGYLDFLSSEGRVAA